MFYYVNKVILRLRWLLESVNITLSSVNIF